MSSRRPPFDLSQRFLWELRLRLVGEMSEVFAGELGHTGARGPGKTLYAPWSGVGRGRGRPKKSQTVGEDCWGTSEGCSPLDPPSSVCRLPTPPS